MAQNIVIVVQKGGPTFIVIAIAIEEHRWHIEPVIFGAIISIQIQCVQLINSKIEFIDMHLNALNCYWFR